MRRRPVRLSTSRAAGRKDRMPPADRFLTRSERGNDATTIDARHPAGQAWSTGNLVRPLVHGGSYFADLAAALARQRAGDLVMFTDWRGDPDQRLTVDGDGIATLLAAASSRGVAVHGLVWRSHWDRLTFSAAENRRLDEDINAAGGCCL